MHDQIACFQAGVVRRRIVSHLSNQDKKLSTVGDFRNQISLTAPGSKVKLTIVRNGKRKTVVVKIGNLDSENVIAQSSEQQADELGITVQTISPELSKQFNVKPGYGVLVTDVKPGSVASAARINPGAVILQVNRINVSTAVDFKKAVEKNISNKRVLLMITVHGMSRYVVLSWR